VEHVRWIGRSLHQGRGALLLIWTCWGTLFLLALIFTHRYSVRMPTFDDWALLTDVYSGQQPLTWSRLWQQTHEHRLPLPHLIVIGLAWLTGGTLHVENYLNVVLLAGLAATLMEAARRMRDSPRCSDAFFPLALLHLGHHELFLVRLTLNHTLSTVLMGVALALVATQPQALRPRRALLIGVLLACLPLCGANGLPGVLAGAAWLVCHPWRAEVAADPQVKWSRWLHYGIALILLALVGSYVAEYRRLSHHPPPGDLGRFLEALGRACSLSISAGITNAWLWAGMVVPALVTVATLLLLWKWRVECAERARALGLLCFLAAAVAVILALSWGRGGLGAAAMSAPRYSIVTLPALLVVYLIWVAYAPHRLRGVVEVGLLVLFAWTYFPGWRLAQHHAAFVHRQDLAMRRAVEEGAPPAAVLAYGEWAFVPPRAHGLFATKMLDLQRAGFGPFRHLQPEPLWHETACSPQPTRTPGLRWVDPYWEPESPRAQLVYQLPAAPFVHAVRLQFRLPPGLLPGNMFEVGWRETDVRISAHQPPSASYLLETMEREQSLLIWVNCRIDELRITVHQSPCRFAVRELTLLRKAEPEAVVTR
jgi:hypothetical protein